MQRRSAKVFKNGIYVGLLVEKENLWYTFDYDESYYGDPISLTMPINKKHFIFEKFPPFFEGLLPEGAQLEKVLRNLKIDKKDYFGLLMEVGGDLVGDVTVKENL